MQLSKIKDAEFKGVKERFSKIISEHSQSWWSKQLDVSQGLISGNWTAGKLPRVDTLFKILKIKAISPSWFFFNIEPKYLKDLEGVAGDQNRERKRETQLKILEAENELFELREKVKSLECHIKEKELLQLMPFLKNSELGNLSNDNDIFNDHILPLITLMRLLNDVSFKAFELMAKNELNDKKFIKIIDWIKDNFESGKLTTEATLKALEKIT